MGDSILRRRWGDCHGTPFQQTLLAARIKLLGATGIGVKK